MDCTRISPTSGLAPGRTHDIAMLVKRRSEAIPYSVDWYRVQRKIADLAEEARCSVTVDLRGKLLRASIAQDEPEVEKVSRLIEEHVKTKHPRRFYRNWGKG